MARKGGRGGNKAARSAAAKKGWETRRRGGAKAKPAARKATAPTKPKQAAGRRGMPKTTSARGRALTNQRRAADLVRASRGGKGPSAKAVRSVLTAQRARAFYAATGGGKKRSAVKAKSAAKIGKSIRAESRAKATAARAKVAGRPRAGAKPAAVKKTRLARASGRLPNRTGSSKQLTRYNSTQSGSGRRPLDVMGWERDAAKARLATKTDRCRSRTKERRAKQAVTDNRASRATANQARVTAALKKADGSGFRRGTRKERRSIFTAQAALSFYRGNSAVDTQRVDVRRPGFRLPRSKR